jgi:hypothetical protein
MRTFGIVAIAALAFAASAEASCKADARKLVRVSLFLLLLGCTRG